MEKPKVKSVKEIIDNIEKGKDSVEVMPTGFKRLDDWLDGGFLRKELVIVGGNTGIGKSYLAGQFMYNIAKKGFRCAYFSLEISNEMVVSRMMGALSNLKPTRIIMGLLRPEEFEAKIEAKADLEVLGDGIYFYDDTYILEDILAEIKKNKYDLTVVDFLQNVMTKGEDEYARLSKIALELQKAAKEVDGVVLALSQLSNAVARDGTKGKVLEYKGSGSIATACDLGFFIVRGSDEWNPFSDNPLKLCLRKNRRGGSGMDFDLMFKTPGGKIYEK